MMSSLLEKGRAGERLEGCDVIDMHGHLGRSDILIPGSSPEGLVRTMDRLGVKMIVCSHLGSNPILRRLGNDRVLAAMKEYPGRIKGYVRLWPHSQDWVRTETKRCFDNGFVGIKLHTGCGFPYDDPAYTPAIEAAAERRMPVLFHTWCGEELTQIRKLAEKHPGASFLVAHAGAEKEEPYIQMAKDYENIYLELCLSLAPRGLIERLVESVGVGKVVWGSDAVFLTMPQQIGRVLGAHLTEDEKKQILSENAQRILSRIRK